ncbi:hypothetical protein [Acrocarpospora phusangensis]|uniref:hypothetical protein n=1 Tax=Acrocarpospora phusangensis TaxID=1070424 RepID=UPI00194DD516|nr:hypothetical protein [Acrocarpospora phusangensis]
MARVIGRRQQVDELDPDVVGDDVEVVEHDDQTRAGHRQVHQDGDHHVGAAPERLGPRPPPVRRRPA